MMWTLRLYNTSLAQYIKKQPSFYIGSDCTCTYRKIGRLFLSLSLVNPNSLFHSAQEIGRERPYQEIAGETPNQIGCFQRAYYKEILQILLLMSSSISYSRKWMNVFIQTDTLIYYSTIKLLNNTFPLLRSRYYIILSSSFLVTLGIVW